MSINTGGAEQVLIESLHKRIEQLESPTLPDDVAEMVERLRNERYITTADWILKEVREAADLLERQARLYQYCCECRKDEQDTIGRLREKIEQLEALIITASNSGPQAAVDLIKSKAAALQENMVDECQQCGEEPAAELHVCPYYSEIYAIEDLCNCCDKCQQECADDI